MRCYNIYLTLEREILILEEGLLLQIYQHFALHGMSACTVVNILDDKNWFHVYPPPKKLAKG